MVDPKKRNNPYPFIKRALEILKKRQGQTIVEIGSMRAMLNHPIDEYHHDCCCDGHSSALWALSGLEFYTIDISRQSFETTQKVVLDRFHCSNANILHGDGIAFLQSFSKNIDLLFLDAWDVDNSDYAEKHLEAYKVAQKNLHEKSLILIDDTDVYWDFQKRELFFSTDGLSGKGKLVIPEAQKDGYSVVFQGRQTLLAKGIAE